MLTCDVPRLRHSGSIVILNAAPIIQRRAAAQVPCARCSHSNKSAWNSSANSLARCV